MSTPESRQPQAPDAPAEIGKHGEIELVVPVFATRTGPDTVQLAIGTTVIVVSPAEAKRFAGMILEAAGDGFHRSFRRGASAEASTPEAGG